MYKILKLIGWIFKFKKNMRHNRVVADFTALYHKDSEKEVRDKAVGETLLKIEQEENQLKLAKQLLKVYVRNIFKKNNRTDDSGEKRESEVSEEKPGRA